MTLHSFNPTGDQCPFLELGDHRCNSHFTLDRLGDALGECFGEYRRCPNFYRLAHQNPQMLVVTVNGRRLQPTGT